MMTNRYLLCAICFVCSLHVAAQLQEETPRGNKFLLGAQAGVNNYASPVGDLYFSYDFRLWQKQFLARVGYSYKSAEIDFSGVNRMHYSSHGNFVDLNMYLSRNIYIGLGLGIHLNRVNEDDQVRYETATLRRPPIWFIGYMSTVQAGYIVDFSSRFRLNFEGEFAIHTFSEEAANGYPDGQARPSPGFTTSRSVFLGQATVGIMYILN